eukprot:2734596-Rhodomonas_salina.3
MSGRELVAQLRPTRGAHQDLDLRRTQRSSVGSASDTNELCKLVSSIFVWDLVTCSGVHERRADSKRPG